ncbi:excisionase family protein [Enterobacter roggenkampii]|nr:excisionase family protein [Enterobacter roggenkampii]
MKTSIINGSEVSRLSVAIHYSGDCQPKDNSPIMYNRLEVDAWVERQKPAVPRQRK